MNTRSQIICAWCGIFCMIAMFIGFWPAAGFLPPPLPSASAEEIAAMFRENATGIRIGTVFIVIAGAFYMPFAAVISAQMRRIESRKTPVLSYTQLGAGVVGVILFVIPALIWTTAAFRPERDPQIVQMLNDLAWLIFMMGIPVVLVQNAALGFAILSDASQRPLYPRWLGFFTLWSAVLYQPGCFVTFFKSGPFAWNGLLAFWMALAIFGPWLVVMAVYVIKAARQLAAEGR